MSDALAAGEGPRVVVVDDDPALRRATARVLRMAGYAVTECESGTLASRLITPDAFDVVVCDIDMPGLSGIDLLRLLRERGILVPVLLMTGGPTLDTAMKAVEHGAFKYLPKPIDADTLRAAVERAVTERSGVGRRHSPESSGALLASDAQTRASVIEGGVLGGHYRLRRLLGEGGMSQVWEAENLRTGRVVALKLLSAALNARVNMRKRLLREARAASLAGHPNVVDVYDVFELADGTPVLTMALLHGQTLAHRLSEEGPLSMREVADVFVQVVSAVGAAHARGVIHRDLKPDNVFLCDEAGRVTVKVLDFGVAKLVAGEDGGGAPLTATGAMVGTPGYMSPEQCMGESDVDHRADVWAIAAMIYEALSGARPLGGENVGQMLKRFFARGIAPLGERARGAPADLAALVDRGLARERDERPDLRELYAALQSHTQVAAPPFGPPAAPPPSEVRLKTSALANARTEQGDTSALLRHRS